MLVAALMITQSFLYNAIFFTYGLVLKFFFHVKATDVPLLLLRVRGGQPARPADDRPAVRHDRPQEDDLGHLHPVRGPARDHRLPVQGR